VGGVWMRLVVVWACEGGNLINGGRLQFYAGRCKAETANRGMRNCFHEAPGGVLVVDLACLGCAHNSLLRGNRSLRSRT